MAKPNDVINQIKKATRRKFTAEEKPRIVLEGLRGDTSISEICRREGIVASVYSKWSKAFLEAGKNGLTKDTLRDATSDEVKKLKTENQQLYAVCLHGKRIKDKNLSCIVRRDP